MRQALRKAGLATLHLLTGAALGLVCYVTIGLMLFAVAATVVVVGAGMLPEAVRLLHLLARFERRRTGAWTGVTVEAAHLPLDRGRLAERVRTVATDPGTYRALGWLCAQLLYGLLLCYLALVLWPLALLVDGALGLLGRRPAVLPLIVALASLEASFSHALLRPSPSTRLADRVAQLSATRAGAVAAHGDELRRIERDLHDGTQARLVALSMRLGLALRAYDRDQGNVRPLLDEARRQAEEALTELRHVVRGIHPPVLSDRGLAGAVRALAADSGLEVRVTVEGLADGAEDRSRAPAPVEAAAYFVVAEALTNAAKHSGAARAVVELVRTEGQVRVRIRDDGAGGADESRGTGLLGVRRRVAALDGAVRLSSPPGGPTELEALLPCA
ncbi:sensor histidine kinase [Streptomyces cacaoi]|uniref:sensor histidine kinase n=1 Tax=Streptomyces cacaoi TaxID=1898 RepID=UPI00263294CB|nr:sensor histidine kinase [Streptomyces cacaoi]